DGQRATASPAGRPRCGQRRRPTCGPRRNTAPRRRDVAPCAARQPMIPTEVAGMLTRYKAWANEITFSTVAALPEGEATKPRPTLFKNIVHTLNHPLVIDSIFQAHLEGRPHGFTARNTPTHPPLDELWRAV